MYPQAMTVEEVGDLAERAYAGFPCAFRELFEATEFAILVEEEPHPRGIAGLCVRPLKTIFIYAHTIAHGACCYDDAGRFRVVRHVLRHEMAHALGLEHRDMEDPALQLTWATDPIPIR